MRLRPGVHPVAAAGFSSVAEVYERARPSYPEEAVEWITARGRLEPGRTVVDLGAGTGKLTRLLVGSGARVVAVEPLAEMREKLVEMVPGVEALDGTAEELPFADGSVDVITCAQAFHWFDLDRALPELGRVLADDGLLVLVWNTRDLGDELQGALEEVLAPHRGWVAGQVDDSWRAAIESSPFFGEVERRSFRLEQLVTGDDVVDRVASTSFVAAMGPVERDVVLAQVRALVVGREEPFRFPYSTEGFAIPRRREGYSERGTPV